MLMRLMMVLILSLFVISCDQTQSVTSVTNEALSDERYIVVYENAHDRSIVRNRYGLNVVSSVSNVMCADIVLGSRSIESLEHDANVKTVMKDFKYTVPMDVVNTTKYSDNLSAKSTQKLTWGVRACGGAINASSSEKLAWIVDSGIDTDHPDLNVYTAFGANFVVGKTSFEDERGHGTHVAGIIGAKNNTFGVVGLAAGIKVVPIRVLDENGSGYFSWSIEAFDYIATLADSGDVVNYSVGSSTRYTNTVLEDAIKNLADMGVIVCISAGNQTDDCVYYSPARLNYPNVYTLAGMTASRNWYGQSNYGEPVDWIMPAGLIESTYLNGGYATLNGTSMSAAHASGVLLTGKIKIGGTVTYTPTGTVNTYGTRQ